MKSGTYLRTARRLCGVGLSARIRVFEAEGGGERGAAEGRDGDSGRVLSVGGMIGVRH